MQIMDSLVEHVVGGFLGRRGDRRGLSVHMPLSAGPSAPLFLPAASLTLTVSQSLHFPLHSFISIPFVMPRSLCSCSLLAGMFNLKMHQKYYFYRRDIFKICYSYVSVWTDVVCITNTRHTSSGTRDSPVVH